MEENKQFFSLLRFALGLEQEFNFYPAPKEWEQIYYIAQKQALVGVLYQALNDLQTEQRPPKQIVLRWALQAESIRKLNLLMNSECARLTALFESQGHNSVILKGQANARLYPNKLSRHPGDIDIYVNGGLECITEMLIKNDMLEKKPVVDYKASPHEAALSYHHIHLPPNEKGATVEVHFRPSSDNYNPLTNKRLQLFLDKEILTTKMVCEGFYVPSIRFALIMQLSHIQHHFLSGGIGLRQICDYLMLLQNSTENDRNIVSEHLHKLGLFRTAGALMWLLKEIFNLDEYLMICKPDTFRGKMMLKDIFKGGNFGQYNLDNPVMQIKPWKRFFLSKRSHIKLIRFDFREIFWAELLYWKCIIITLPERIRRRSLSLSNPRIDRQ